MTQVPLGEFAALNSKTPIEVFQHLSTDKDVNIRRVVAENIHTPAKLLSVLSKDADSLVIQAVAQNIKTPIEVLATLSQNEDYEVRRAVAGNSATPVEILKELVEDRNKYVSTAVIENPQTPDSLLDETSFNLMEVLLDAESRGSELAVKLREIYQNFDRKLAKEKYEELQEILQSMRDDFDEIISNYDEDEQHDAFDEFYENGWHETLFDSDFSPVNTSGESFQLIFDELYKSMTETGAFGNATVLEDICGWTNEMNLWGFLISPFVPRNVLRTILGWNATSNNYMSSIAVSPILSKRLLHYAADSIISVGGSEWIGLALIVNASSDLYVLDATCKYGGDDVSRSYCALPTRGGGDIEEIGVCGPLVGKNWFAGSEVFEDWSEDDLFGPLSEGAPRLLRNLVKVAELYLGTSQGAMESSRDSLANSEYFGRLLVCFRMIQEFKFSRAKIDEELDSDSSLVRTVLYWKPGLDSDKQKKLESKGILFPEEVGKLLVTGWTEDLNLIL